MVLEKDREKEHKKPDTKVEPTKKEIEELYFNKNLSLKETGERFGLSYHYMRMWFKYYGIETKFSNKSLKKDFFQNIDTEEKAYWLGFVWCDGNINLRKLKDGSYDNCFSLDLCERDHKHLYKLKESLKASNKVEKLKTVEASYTSDKWRYRIRVKNTEFVHSLYFKYGMIPYRTNIKKLKEHVPSHLMKHFIRGVVDADGSVVLCKSPNRAGKEVVEHRTISVGIYSQRELLDWITEHLFLSNLTYSKRKMTPVHTGGLSDMYSVSIGGNIQAKEVLDYLYGDATIYMDRKYDTYLKIVDYIKERESLLNV